MKDKFLDPFLVDEQVKFRLKDGWGSNALVVKEKLPGWLAGFDVPVLKNFLKLNKPPEKTTVEEVAEYYMKALPMVVFEEPAERREGVVEEQFSQWIILGEVVLQKKYFDYITLRKKQFYNSILITQGCSENIAVFLRECQPVAVIAGLMAKADRIREISEFLKQRLEAS